MFVGFVHTLVILPDPIKLAIGALVAFGVAALFAWIASVWPGLAEFLGPYKEQAIVLVSGAIITWIEAQLNLYPQYEPLTNAILFALAVALGLFGLPFVAFKFFQRRGSRVFRSFRATY